MIWNLIKQDEILKAIQELLNIKEKGKYKLKWYYFLSWCYYKLNQRENLFKVINEADEIDTDDMMSRSKINVIKYLSNNKDNKKTLRLIKDEYQKNQSYMDSEDKMFYLEILIEEYSKLAYYKEVNKYLKQVLKL